MSAPLLTTKLHIPPLRAEIVRRSHLVDRLNAGLGGKLTLVSAPAGFGKTTLLSEWIHESGQIPPPASIAWLSLDQSDNDPARFLAYLGTALEGVEGSLGSLTQTLLHSPQPIPMKSMLTRVLNSVAALDRRILIVLDDYHQISTPGIHEGIGYLLEHQPHNLHLVLATRADPPLPTHRLRAHGHLTELRSDDLRFRTDEAATFLNSMMGLDLSGEDVKALEDRTEGWVAGLQLAAISLQGRADAHRFIVAFSGSHHYVLEYLTEEVIRCQPEPIQQFLIETSILDRLCGPLCDTVCSACMKANSEQLLTELERRNLFTIPLDDDRRWYRYHHLFADLLGNLLRKTLPEDAIHNLHLRASEWFENNGAVEDAIKHALRGQDFEGAARLIEGRAHIVLSQGRLATLIQWLELLPPDVLRSRSRLCLQKGWALHLSGRSGAAERVLNEASTVLQTLPPSPENKALRGELAALLTGIATLTKTPPKIIQQAREALACLPEESSVSRARVHIALGTAYAYDDDSENAVLVWQQAKDMALGAGNLFLATAAIELLAGLYIYHLGRLHEAAQILHDVLAMGTTKDGLRLPFTATAHVLLSQVYLEWNNLDEAADLLKKGFVLIEQAGIGYSLPYAYCTQASLELAKGNSAGASMALQEAEVAVKGQPLLHIVMHQAACQVCLHLHLGDYAKAHQWATRPFQTSNCEAPDRLPTYLSEIQRISLARVYSAQGKADHVLDTLAGVQDQALAAGRVAHVIAGSLLEALALSANGATREALQSLARALELAEPEGCVQVFLETDPALQAILTDFQRQTTGSVHSHLLPYVAKLLAVFPKVSPQTASRSKQEQYADALDFPEPLTRRELEVLSLLCQGYSNQEIADRLVVTLHTVKKHTSNIYGKLLVTSRTRAVVRARELGLCSTHH